MAVRRILYGLFLLAAAALFLLYDGYPGLFLLAGALALPLLSLAAGIPAARALRLRLEPSVPQPLLREEGVWLLRVEGSSPFPAGRLTVRLREENLLTGARRHAVLRRAAPARGETLSLPMDTGHCGAVDCRVVSLRALDWLGLFAIPVRRPAPARALVFPVPVPEAELPSPVSSDPEPGVSPFAAGRDGLSQDYELRDYRPGDPIRAIHWKLSSKRDSLIVREPPPAGAARAAVTFDCAGSPEALDRVLGLLASVSGALLRRGVPHRVGWRDADGAPCWEEVSSPAGLDRCLERILSRPAAGQAGPPPAAGAPLHFHLPAGEEGAP